MVVGNGLQVVDGGSTTIIQMKADVTVPIKALGIFQQRGGEGGRGKGIN